MSTESAFEAFCASHAQQQQHEGLEVPSRLSHSFSYFQWREVARKKFLESHGKDSQDGDEPVYRRARAEDGAAPAGILEPHTHSPLADAIAAQVAASLQKQSSLSAAPASLRHAAQESFPMPRASADLPTFLALAETALRLTLWHHENEPLALTVARLRPILHHLERKGHLRHQQNRFPVVQVLLDLLSWRIIARRWDRLTPNMRVSAVEAMQRLCTSVRTPAALELFSAVQKLDLQSSVVFVPFAHINSLVAQTSASVPFQFDGCRDLACLYPEPTEELCLPGEVQPPSEVPRTSPPATAAGPTTSSAQREDPIELDEEKSDVRVGDLLMVEATLPETSKVVVPSTEAIPSAPDNVSSCAAAPVLQEVPRASGSLATPADTSQARHLLRPMATQNGYRACVSRYHERYADASKHASRECHYCATCHLMEVVFHGEKRSCTWKHWPTRRKILFHLKRFPDVLKLALSRFAAMENGEVLAATNEVPL